MKSKAKIETVVFDALVQVLVVRLEDKMLMSNVFQGIRNRVDGLLSLFLVHVGALSFLTFVIFCGVFLVWICGGSQDIVLEVFW